MGLEKGAKTGRDRPRQAKTRKRGERKRGERREKEREIGPFTPRGGGVCWPIRGILPRASPPPGRRAS